MAGLCFYFLSRPSLSLVVVAVAVADVVVVVVVVVVTEFPIERRWQRFSLSKRTVAGFSRVSPTFTQFHRRNSFHRSSFVSFGGLFVFRFGAPSLRRRRRRRRRRRFVSFDSGLFIKGNHYEFFFCKNKKFAGVSGSFDKAASASSSSEAASPDLSFCVAFLLSPSLSVLFCFFVQPFLKIVF